MQGTKYDQIPDSMIQTVPQEIPEDVQEKLAPYEGLTLADLKGNKRLDGESYEDYRLRREIENQFRNHYLKGTAIKTSAGYNRATKKRMWKIYKREQRGELLVVQKAERKPKQCPRCYKMFPKCDLPIHMLIHKRKEV